MRTGWIRYTASGDDELVIAPASYGPRGSGAEMRYALGDSPFGRVLIASTAYGICWLGLAAPDDRLQAELRGDYPAAACVRDDRLIELTAASIIDYVEGRRGNLDLPIDVRATPFEAAVWYQLSQIPRGSTRSYGAIAARLGKPSASRAVGHANGANPIAVVIPCHRAIGSSGELTGYRWGLEVKQRLLEHERSAVQPPRSPTVS